MRLSKYLLATSKLFNPKYGCGSWIFSDNKKYLDFTSGMGVLTTGYSNPVVIKGVKNQLDKYVHYPQQLFNTDHISHTLTQNLLNIMPNASLDNIMYANSESEANTHAIKLARKYTQKPYIISINRGFNRKSHGDNIISSDINTLPYIPGIFFCKENNKESFDNILDYQCSPNQISCVILESIQKDGSCLLKTDFLQHIKTKCEANNILLIADETNCGIGRTGTHWNIEQTGVIPDIMTFGRSIASGFPIAGIVSRSDIVNNVNNANNVNNVDARGITALSYAAANATLYVINRENLLYNTKNMGNYLKRELINIPHTKVVNQVGLMTGIEYFFSEEDPRRVGKIVTKLNENEILVSSSNKYLRILPPLNTNYKECDFFLEKYSEVMKSI